MKKIFLLITLSFVIIFHAGAQTKTAYQVVSELCTSSNYSTSLAQSFLGMYTMQVYYDGNLFTGSLYHFNTSVGVGNIVQKSTTSSTSLTTTLKYNVLECYTSTSIPTQKEVIAGSCTVYGSAKLSLTPGPLSSITPVNLGSLVCITPTGSTITIGIPSSMQVIGTSLITGYSLSGVATMPDGSKRNIMIKIRPQFIEG